MIELFKKRIEITPATEKNAAQNYATIAFLYIKKGDKESAIQALDAGQSLIPTFKKSASCFIANIKAGKEPQTGC